MNKEITYTNELILSSIVLLYNWAFYKYIEWDKLSGLGKISIFIFVNHVCGLIAWKRKNEYTIPPLGQNILQKGFGHKH